MMKPLKNWKLEIDTTDFGSVEFILESHDKKIKKRYPMRPQESDKILEYLGGYLKTNKITPPLPSPLRGGIGRGAIKEIVIYKGEGSFTGLRVGAAIADALSLAWQVPVKVKIKK